MREVPTSKISSDFKFHSEIKTNYFVSDLEDALNPKQYTEEKEEEGRKVEINKDVEEGLYKMSSGLGREEISVPFSLQKYIESLIKNGRALRSFKEFYFDSKKTKAKWRDILARYHDAGGFGNEEYTKALKLLDGEDETEFAVEKESKINLKKITAERQAPNVEENLDGKLEVSRAKYVAEYIDWKNKNRTKKIKYARLLSDLGVDKQLPTQEEPKDLLNARESWLSVRKAKSEREVRKLDFIESEYDLVSSLIKTSLPPKERSAFEKSQVSWNKLSPAQKMALSVSLLASDTTFGNLGLSSVGTFVGFRSPKIEIENFVTNPTGRTVDGIFKKGKEVELVSRINEDRLNLRDAAFVRAIEEETNADKKRILMKAADLVRKVVDIVPQISIQPIELRLSSKDFSEGLRYLKERITEQYENGRVPQVVRENIIEKLDVELAREFGFRVSEENILGTFAGEIFSLDQSGNISIRHLDGSKDTIINTLAQVKVKHVPQMEMPQELKAEKIAIKKVSEIVKQVPERVVEEKASFVFNNMEIAHKQGGILTLDDKFQDGDKFKAARSAFVEAFEQDGLETKVGTTPIAIPFEGGKIYVIAGVGEDNRTIQVLLNGKEIARGLLSDKGPKVELLDAPGVKSGFFFADTVYERAFKQVKSMIKNLKPVEESGLKTVI
jgi:hypothetical protein